MSKKENSLKILKSIKSAKKYLMELDKPKVLIPTMGALHDGHLSLIEIAKKLNIHTIVSIFINPIQFNDKKDLEKYPRTLIQDIQKLKALNVDTLFAPNVENIYDKNFQTSISVKNLQKNLCGTNRPGHFDGMATIVLKLFNIIKPDYAIFGKKDFQQLEIIKRMCLDLNLNIKIIEGKIIREKSGLAMSSRNSLLTKNNLILAPKIYEGLKLVKKSFTSSNKFKSQSVIKKLRDFYLKNGLKKIDYIEIVDKETLVKTKKIKKGDTIAVAIKLGKIRLIDNLQF